MTYIMFYLTLFVYVVNMRVTYCYIIVLAYEEDVMMLYITLNIITSL